MLNPILKSDLKLTLVDGRLSVRGSRALVGEFSTAIERWKPELIKIINGESVSNVGDCDACNADLLGIVTFDSYVNRVCPDCGKWFRCLEPMTHQRESSCAGKHESVELNKVAADLAGSTTELPNYEGVE